MVRCVRTRLCQSQRTNLDLLEGSAHEKVKDDYSSNLTHHQHQLCAEKFDAFLKLCTNVGNVDVRNTLFHQCESEQIRFSDSRENPRSK